MDGYDAGAELKGGMRADTTGFPDSGVSTLSRGRSLPSLDQYTYIMIPNSYRELRIEDWLIILATIQARN